MKTLVSSILLLLALIACQTTPAPTPITATWSTSAINYRGENGKRYAYTCPAIDTLPGSTIWGTDTYTDDSSICKAGVHAGKITITGGTVTIEIRAGQATYTGSVRNGVTSSDYAIWDGSYVFI